MMSTTNRVGDTMGSVMLKNWRTLEAPSSSAASYRDREMFWMPDSSSTAS